MYRFTVHLAVCLLLLSVPSAFAQLVVGSNVDLSKRAENEAGPIIAIDPNNPLRLFVSSNLNKIPGQDAGILSSRSSDGGVHWNTVDIANGKDTLSPACCDPNARFDSFGNLWLTYLGEDSKIKLILSTNGGQTWTKIGSFGFGDEPSVAVGAGTVWITFHDGNGTMSATGAPVSGLGSVGSFLPLEVAPGSSDGHYGDIVIGPSGEVLITYQIPSTGEGPGEIYVNLDPDGLGSSAFKARVHVSHTEVGGFDFIPPQSGRSIDAEAQLAWDDSGGLYNNRIYLVYTDEFPAESANTDILLRYSDDRGSTWSSPLRVNDDGGKRSQFLPAIAVDEKSGDVAISWYDSRNDTGSGPGDTDGIANDDGEQFVTISNDGGRTVFPNVRISSGPSNSADSMGRYDFGDYEGIAFDSGIIYPVWADNSNVTHSNPNGALSRLDIYTSELQDTTGGPQLGVLPVKPSQGTLNFFYSQTFRPTGGTKPYTFHESGILPPGLTFNCSANACILSGTPTASGTFKFHLKVNDSSNHSGDRNYSVKIAANCTFCDDFEDGILSSSWTYSKPVWAENNGSLMVTTTGKVSAVAAPAFPGCTDCSMEASIESSGGKSNKVWFLVWHEDKKNTVEVVMQAGSGKWTLDQRVNGKVVAKATAHSTISVNTFYDVKVNFDGNDFVLSVNGEDIITLPSAVTPLGTVGFQVKNTTAHFGSILVNQ